VPWVEEKDTIIHNITHRMSSPLVTVLRRRVPNPDGSMVEKPPIFGPKNVSNKSNGFVCKKKNS